MRRIGIIHLQQVLSLLLERCLILIQMVLKMFHTAGLPSPASPPLAHIQETTRQMVHLFIQDLGQDGFYLKTQQPQEHG